MQRPAPSILKILFIALVLLLAHSEVAHAQWTKANNGTTNVSNCVLLTDGTVVCQEGETTSTLVRLTPDQFGSYANGSWSDTNISPLPTGYAPRFFCSAVLADGRVVFIGGEYNSGTTGETNLAAILDPTADGGKGTWTTLNPPDGGASPWNQIGDAPCVILPNEKLLLGSIFNSQIAELDPATLTWTDLSPTNKADANGEEGFTLLPDGTILVVDTGFGPNTGDFTGISKTAEIYTPPPTNSWALTGPSTGGVILDGNVPSCCVPETGPQILRPDGTVIAIGATPNTASYNYLTGVWTAGPTFPTAVSAYPSACGGTVGNYFSAGEADGPGSILPNGNVLVAASPVDNTGNELTCSTFFEYDGTNLNPITSASTTFDGARTFGMRMLVLPTGDVLVTAGGGSDVELYNNGQPYQSAWQPTITSSPAFVGLGGTYNITGTQFNGLSSGAAYGDDSTFATNYPLVRITNITTSHVFYARTHDHSTMGVATGSAPVSTNFDVPASMETGASTLVVVANGIPSASFSINVDSLTSTLSYTGPASGDYNDAVTVQASLSQSGSPVSGETVTFTLGSGSGTETCSATTNGSGIASCSITPNQAAGSYTLTATFSGDLTYGASTVSAGFNINLEDISLAYTGATSGDYNDSATAQAVLTDPDSGLPISGKTVTFALGSGAGTETCSTTTNGSGLASCSITPNQAAGPYTLTASFAGDAFYAATSTSPTFTIKLEDTLVTYSGATTSDYHDAATVQAVLTDPDSGLPISGKTLTFVLGSGAGTETCAAITNGAGLAACSITPNQAAGSYTLTAAFAGDAFYAASAASPAFIITHEQTTIQFTASSPTVIANSHPVTFSATLLEDGTTPPVPFGQLVTFTLGSGVTAQTCTGATNAAGVATCTIAIVNQPLGPNTVGVAFAGDPYYLPSSASEAVIDFAFLAQGSMIIGNNDAASGTAVEFWGANWSTVNSLTGGLAPTSFKGFANNSPQSCGGTWSTSTGNSPPPPATLPSYMGVIASSKVVQGGSAVTGDVPIIVVVKTGPGYAPNAGHPGTGTVVATYCH